MNELNIIYGAGEGMITLYSAYYIYYIHCRHLMKHVVVDPMFGLVYWDLTPQQQPGSYQGGVMMVMKSVFWCVDPM